MNRLVKWTQWMGAGAIVMVSMTGCQDTNNNNQPDTISGPAASKAVENTAEAAGREAKEAGQAIENTAEAAGQAVENTAAAAGQAVEKTAEAAKDVGEKAVTGAAKAVKGTSDAVKGAVNTGNVKTAILANPSVKGANLDVTTDAKTGTVTLSGTVSNAAQKTVAGKIAAREAAGHKIINNLKVTGGKKG